MLTVQIDAAAAAAATYLSPLQHAQVTCQTLTEVEMPCTVAPAAHSLELLLQPAV